MRKTTLQFVVALCVCFAPLALAQDTATLTGTIRDNTGAVIPGASLSIKNTGKGIVRQLKTNSDGEYVAAALPPGQYNVSVTLTGFRNYQAQGVILRVAQNARIDITMQVGNAHEEITVHGEGLAQVNTESSELGGTITGKDRITYRQHHGFCLEAQHYPDSVHHPNFPSTILEPGKTYTQTTVYRFSAR